MISPFLKYVLLLSVTFTICSTAMAAPGEPSGKQPVFSFSLGAEFASGDYGTGTGTRSVYAPLILTWFPTERIDAGIEVPYVYQSNANVTTSLFQNNQAKSVSGTMPRLGGPGGGGASGGGSGASVSGLGDIILRLGLIALFESDSFPQLRPSLFVKFPTASASDGLGTGEYDFGGGVETLKWLGDLFLYGEALYTYQGRVPGFELKNYLSYKAGVGYQVTEGVRPMLMIKGSTAPSRYSGDLLEARVRALWEIADGTELDLYVSHGITESSPEYGGGLAVTYTF